MAYFRYALLCIITSFTTITPYGFNQVCINLPQHFLQKFEQTSLYDHFGQQLFSSSNLIELYSLVNSLFAVGALCGSLLVSPVAEYFGRRAGLFVVAGSIQAVASMFQGLAVPMDSFELFLACRLLTGLASVLAAGLATIYIIEISPKQYRGIAGSLTHTGHAFGCFLGMSLGMDSFLGKPEYIPYFLAAMSPLALTAVFLGVIGLLPESPRFAFITLGDHEKARKALERLGFSESQSTDTINEMQMELAEEAKVEHNSQKRSVWRHLINDPVAYYACVAAVLINIAQGLTIYYPMLTYSTVMLREFGASRHRAQWFTSAIGIADIVSALACPWVVNCLPRRVAFIGNMLGMSLCTVVMWTSGGILFSDMSLRVDHFDLLIYTFVVAALVMTVMFSFGPGPISMFIPAEISPQHTRSLTVSITKASRWLVIALASQVYYGFLETWGPHSFAPYFFLSLAATLGVIFTMPESQRRTLTEMWAHLDALHKTTPPPSKTPSRKSSAVEKKPLDHSDDQN